MSPAIGIFVIVAAFINGLLVGIAVMLRRNHKGDTQ